MWLFSNRQMPHLFPTECAGFKGCSGQSAILRIKYGGSWGTIVTFINGFFHVFQNISIKAHFCSRRTRIFTSLTLSFLYFSLKTLRHVRTSASIRHQHIYLSLPQWLNFLALDANLHRQTTVLLKFDANSITNQLANTWLQMAAKNVHCMYTSMMGMDWFDELGSRLGKVSRSTCFLWRGAGQAQSEKVCWLSDWLNRKCMRTRYVYRLQFVVQTTKTEKTIITPFISTYKGWFLPQDKNNKDGNRLKVRVHSFFKQAAPSDNHATFAGCTRLDECHTKAM